MFDDVPETEKKPKIEIVYLIDKPISLTIDLPPSMFLYQPFSLLKGLTSLLSIEVKQPLIHIRSFSTMLPYAIHFGAYITII